MSCAVCHELLCSIYAAALSNMSLEEGTVKVLSDSQKENPTDHFTANMCSCLFLFSICVCPWFSFPSDGRDDLGISFLCV